TRATDSSGQPSSSWAQARTGLVHTGCNLVVVTMHQLSGTGEVVDPRQHHSRWRLQGEGGPTLRLETSLPEPVGQLRVHPHDLLLLLLPLQGRPARTRCQNDRPARLLL